MELDKQTGIAIRVMTIHDYDEVHRLWTSTPGMGLNTLDDSRNGIEMYLLRNPTTCFVAVREDRVVGSILCGHDGRRGYMYHAAVAAAERNRGVGKALLDAACAALEREGINKVALVVFSHNGIGNRFWEKQGFTARNDLIYRNKVLNAAMRSDT